MDRIIHSVIDDDLYKLTMQETVLRQFEGIGLEARFVNRGGTQFPDGFAAKLQEQINLMGDLELADEEYAFMKDRCYYLRPWYLDWLKQYRFNPQEVFINQEGGDLSVTVRGPWWSAIRWEVPTMAIISELYYKMTDQKPTHDWRTAAYDKGVYLKRAGVTYADFGTRRRYSYDVHDGVVEQLAKFQKATGHGDFVGTSNIHLAHKYNLVPIGTYAHELVMGMAAMYGFVMANEKAMEAWQEEFGADLGTALTDTFTTDAFLNSFTKHYAKLFDGVRHDSGDPYKFIEKMVNHYKKCVINPQTKTIVFSDGLNVADAISIARCCQDQINCAMGIGTHFTNDVGPKALNMVIKAFAFYIPGRGWRNICKLSDDHGKASGDQKAIENARWELGLAA